MGIPIWHTDQRKLSNSCFSDRFQQRLVGSFGLPGKSTTLCFMKNPSIHVLILAGLAATTSIALGQKDRPELGRAIPPEIIARFDADGDGILNDSERRAAREAMARQRAEGNKPRPERDKPRPEGDKPRPEGDKPRPKGDKPRPEGIKPRPEGDKPRPEGDKPRPERDKPRPEGDKPRPEGEKPRPDREAKAARAMEEKMRRFDTNRDGAIDEVERRAAREAMAKERGE
jgi:hypothetical protein